MGAGRPRTGQFKEWLRQVGTRLGEKRANSGWRKSDVQTKVCAGPVMLYVGRAFPPLPDVAHEKLTVEKRCAAYRKCWCWRWRGGEFGGCRYDREVSETADAWDDLTGQMPETE